MFNVLLILNVLSVLSIFNATNMKFILAVHIVFYQLMLC